MYMKHHVIGGFHNLRCLLFRNAWDSGDFSLVVTQFVFFLVFIDHVNTKAFECFWPHIPFSFSAEQLTIRHC